MRKFILVLLLSVPFSTLPAQTNPNVVREGGQWAFFHKNVDPEAMGQTDYYSFGSDTILSARNYKKVFCREKADTSAKRMCPWSLREDEKRLYLYDCTTQKEHVLCDFSLQPGDTLVTDWPLYPPVFVAEKVGDTILPGGSMSLRYVSVRDIHHHEVDLWVEKIGSLQYGIYWGYLFGAVGSVQELLCHSDRNEPLYQNPKFKICHIHYEPGVFWGRVVSVPAPLSPYTENKNTFGLKADDTVYTLSPVYINFESFVFGDKAYSIGDSVEVSGWVYNEVDDAYEEFLMLSVQSIRKQGDYLEEGKIWSVLSGASVEDGFTYTVSVFGEVEKDGHLWKRSRMGESEFLLYRQEGKKIWALCPYDDGEMDTIPFLMFDFGLKKGDTAHLYAGAMKRGMDDVWIVEDVFDSVLEPGQDARRCQQVYFMTDPKTKDIWAEGIGSLTNGMSFLPYGWLRGPSELICVQSATGDILYHNKKYNSCYTDEPTVPGTYTGRLVGMPNPATEIPVMPGVVMGLDCKGKQYILSKEGFFSRHVFAPRHSSNKFGSARLAESKRWFDDEMEIDGILYEVGDSVEIEGVLTSYIDLLNHTYLELEINTIKKIETNGETDNRNPQEVGAVHYDVSLQNLVIESSVEVERLEVMDAQGRCVFRVNNPSGSVSVAHLPQGLYLYRLTAPCTTLSGKFVR